MVSPFAVPRRAICSSTSASGDARPISANVIGSPTLVEKSRTSSTVARGFDSIINWTRTPNDFLPVKKTMRLRDRRQAVVDRVCRGQSGGFEAEPGKQGVRLHQAIERR